MSLAGLASHKNYVALYLTCGADDRANEKLRAAFAAAGKKLDMGKSCIRLKQADDLELGVIGELVAATSVDDLVRVYEQGRGR